MPATGESQQLVVNAGRAFFDTAAGRDSAISNTVTTTVVAPDIFLQKTLEGSGTARTGDEFGYRIRYANRSATLTVPGAVLEDTLPAGLEFVSSSPAAEVDGRVLRWRPGDLAPGQSGEVALRVRVGPVTGAVPVVNRVLFRGDMVGIWTADAAPVELLGPEQTGLSLTQTAGVLEAGIGETVPFTLRVENSGAVTLLDVRVRIRLPDGAAYVLESAVGTESASTAGRELELVVPGPLLPGESRALAFAVAVLSSERDRLVSLGRATAAGGVESGDAEASVRIRRGFAIETRTTIGKVWADLDGDGRQGAGEPGVGGADVWTEDGEIATTDAEGRFSFVNLRPGRHAFRLDPASLPAAYRPARSGEDPVVLDGSGWTSGRVNFRLITRQGSLSAIRLPVSWRLAVRPEPLAGVSSPAEGHPAATAAGPADGSRMAVVEIAISNPYAAPMAGFAVRFEPGPVSYEVWRGDEVVGRGTGSRAALPAMAGGEGLVVRGRVVLADGGAITSVLESGGRAVSRLATRLVEPSVPVDGRFHLAGDPAGLPEPDAGAGGPVEIEITPPVAGWPGEAVFAPPPGWRYEPGSSRAGGEAAADPALMQDRHGETYLLWRVADSAAGLTLALVPADWRAGPREPVRVPGLRAAGSGEAGSSFLTGPGIQIFAPADGTVLPSDRAYIGVRGEAGAPVALFDNDSLVAEAPLRIDGVHDFIAVPLSRGPHRLRVRTVNSWGREQWDSIAVHVTGHPATFELPEGPVRLTADGQSTRTIRVRVLDTWGVPVTAAGIVTVAAAGADVLGTDADRSSAGLQLRADSAGWLAIGIRAGREVRRGTLRLTAGEAVAELPLELVAAVRPTLLTGVGRVGVGAAPDAFGALTLRGRLDDRTSVTVNYDSRRLDAGTDAVGRVTDPIEMTQYPVLGDASLRRVAGSSRNWLAARVERGFDWLAVGDVTTADFAGGLALSGYDRIVTGAAGRVSAGPLTFQGFGSSTSLTVRQSQIRGEGSSGPYRVEPDLQPGTEKVWIETRAADNPQRALARQALTRFTDYQIDYAAGTLLLKRAVPAADASGNPVFIVVTYEAEGGGPAAAVWGGRVQAEAGSILGGGVDSLRLGSLWVHDGGRQWDLVGADLRLLHGDGIEVTGEIAWAESADSSGLAATVGGSLSLLSNALKLTGGWHHVGNGFNNPANAAVRPGSDEIRLGASLKIGLTELRLGHDWLHDGTWGVTRTRTHAGIVQSVTPQVRVEAGLTADQFTTDGLGDGSRASEMKLTWTPLANLSLFGEGRYGFTDEARSTRPDFLGAGALYRVRPGLQLEARHRQAMFKGDSSGYGVTNFGLRTDLGFGTEAWTSYEIAGIDGARNAALVGLNNQLRIGSAWTLNSLFERRMGLSRADLGDPVRALPLVRQEEDYWSAAIGAELMPDSAPYRLSARGEYRDGEQRSARLLTLAGDISIRRSLALLSRQEYMYGRLPVGGSVRSGHDLSSLWALAFRPVGGDAFNVLAKIQWLESENPTRAAVLDAGGRESRRIAAVEMIWAPAAPLELALRYAARHTTADVPTEGVGSFVVRSRADFIGARAALEIAHRLHLRMDARLLAERGTGASRADVAPQLGWSPFGPWEIAAGHRLGSLRDPDFALGQGQGWFLTFGVRLTEKSLGSAADFWRDRLGRDGAAR